MNKTDSSPNVIIFKAIDHAIWFGLVLFVLDRINKETDLATLFQTVNTGQY